MKERQKVMATNEKDHNPKIISADIKWRDDIMPEGKYREDEYHDTRSTYHEGVALEDLLRNNGFSNKDGRNLEYEVQKVRMFDSLEKYHEAARDGFKTYDAMHDTTPPFKNLDELDKVIDSDFVFSKLIDKSSPETLHKIFNAIIDNASPETKNKIFDAAVSKMLKDKPDDATIKNPDNTISAERSRHDNFTTPIVTVTNSYISAREAKMQQIKNLAAQAKDSADNNEKDSKRWHSMP